MSDFETHRGHVATFLPMATEPLKTCLPKNYEPVDGHGDVIAVELGDMLGRPLVYEVGRLAVVRWSDPLDPKFKDMPPYPEKLRQFRPDPSVSEAARELAADIINRYGPLLPYPRAMYHGQLLQEVQQRNRLAITQEVPQHQGRGFIHPAVCSFWVNGRLTRKLTIGTKGNGITGYWEGQKQAEMIEALRTTDRTMPTNPDAFHARDYINQSIGQRKGDEVLWIGLSSAPVMEWEVAGSDMLIQAGIFTPLCLQAERFCELPLGTGEIIKIEQFSDQFDQTQLGFLPKAWANETRIWGSVITRKLNMTTAHLLSANEGNQLGFEGVLDDLRQTAAWRRVNLQHQLKSAQAIMRTIEPEAWHSIFGHAGRVLAARSSLENKEALIASVKLSTILELNMINNVIGAGTHRLYGKPVAWHLENVGLWGEVSGGERIYGQAEAEPRAIELHSLFAYLFDGYSAAALVHAAEGDRPMSIEQFYDYVRNGILERRRDHWLEACPSLGDFVNLCQSHKPSYVVAFRPADTFPLVAVGATDASCLSKQDPYWKNWPIIRRNLYRFLQGVRDAYAL